MPKLPGISHAAAVRVFTNPGFRIAHEGKHTMMSNGRVRLTIHLCGAFAVLLGMVILAAPYSLAQAAALPFEVFGTSDLARVFEDGYGQPKTRLPSLQLFGLRNEVVSGQAVIEAHAAVEGITISVGPPRQSEGTGVIPAENLRWNFVGSIFIQENTPKLRRADLTRPAPAWFPDYLGEARQSSIPKGRLKAVYLTLHIPREATPGEYRTTLTVSAAEASVSLPVSVKVYPLTLPDERHLYVTEWFSTAQFRRHHPVASAGESGFMSLLKTYAENMAAHRQNVFRVGIDLAEGSRTSDGRLQFDFARFDKWAQVFWDTGRMDMLETGFIAAFGEGGWSSSQIRLRDFRVRDAATGQRITVAGEEYLAQFLPALVGHLRAKGWLAKTVFHICDEPSDHNILAWRQASALVHRWAPELRRIDAIETPHCLGELEIWVPKLDHLAAWYEAFQEAQRHGNELWFYTVGIYQGGSLPNKTADVPLIETRLLHWLNYRFGLKGYLHWGFNAWTDDPINAPGQHRGDGWHVYPKADGLLDSLRWEQMRNGLQDYECLWLLQNRLAQIKTTLSPRVAAFMEPARRGREIAAQVIDSFHDYVKDPEALYAARRQAIEETLALDQPPGLILQTNPPEHSPVAQNCVIDVHGWVEPGASLTVNGRATPVATDGLFLQEVSPSQDGRIVLEAKCPAGQKRVVRSFRLRP